MGFVENQNAPTGPRISGLSVSITSSSKMNPAEKAGQNATIVATKMTTAGNQRAHESREAVLASIGEIFKPL
jgi:hypothetical protein